MKQPTLILVMGLPGSGKTTFANKLSLELGLPLISKDDIKVRLFDVYGWKDRKWSKAAGQASYAIMDYIIDEQLRNGNSLVVESTFNPQYDNTSFRNWQKKYDARYFQILCYADAGIIRQRFSKRAVTDNRHVSFIEGEAGLRDLENHIKRGVEALDVEGRVIEVDSSDFSKVDYAGIIKKIQSQLPITTHKV